MGQVLDIVPNHMAVMGADNVWWQDVLEHGPASAYADWFDIDWNPADTHLAGKVQLPVLGDHYGAVLERGELALRFEPATGSFAVWYHEHRLPIDPHLSAHFRRRSPRCARRAPAPSDRGAGVDPLRDSPTFRRAMTRAAHGARA
jgi:maltooligosyltrehalose synthase